MNTGRPPQSGPSPSTQRRFSEVMRCARVMLRVFAGRNAALLSRSMFAMGCLLMATASVSGAGLPSVEEVLAAFIKRAAETKYIRYRAEGIGIIPPNSHMGTDPKTFESTGETFPKEEIQFDWISAGEIDILNQRGIYEDRGRVFNIDDSIFKPYHHKLYGRGTLTDTEHLLPAPPENPANPHPHIKFDLAQDRNPMFPAKGSYFVSDAIQAAFGYIPIERGGFYSISDPAWAVRYNAAIVTSDREDVVTLQFTDESVPGLVLAYRLDCEAAPPHRMLRIERGDFTSVDLKYLNETNELYSMQVKISGFELGQIQFNGNAEFKEFVYSPSLVDFNATASPQEGDWVRDGPRHRVYRFATPSRWSGTRVSVFLLALLGILVSVYLFKRSFGAPRVGN